jgi:serine protease Do
MKKAKWAGQGAGVIFATSLLLTGCDSKDPAQAAEISALKSEVEQLKKENNDLKLEQAGSAGHLKELAATRTRALDAEKALSDLREQVLADKEAQLAELRNRPTEPPASSFGTRIDGTTPESPLAGDPSETAQNDAPTPSDDDTAKKDEDDESTAKRSGDDVPDVGSDSRVKSTTDKDKDKDDEKTAKRKPAIPLPPAVAAKADEVAKTVMPVVVLIEGDNGVGSGFFVRQGDKTYLYTAAHVLSGNNKLTVKTHDGKKFTKFGAFEVANGYDLVRIQMEEEIAEAATLSDSSAIAMNRHVFAVGNSGGGGVLTVLKGSVTGLGPSEFELDAEIIQGNSGGPVFDIETGKVMGVVTHAIAARQDIWAAETRFADVRRFAGRLDGEIRWHPMPITTFLNERRQIDELDRSTRLLYAISMLRPTTYGLRMDTTVKSGVTASQIFYENQDLPAVRDLMQMNNQLAARGINLSERDLIKKYTSFYQQILSTAQRQSKAFNPTGYSPYHRPEGDLSVKWRAEAEKAVANQIERMR